MLSLIGEASKSLHVTFMATTIICLVTYILLEVGKLLLLYDLYLENMTGNILWLFVLTISTVYTSMVSFVTKLQTKANLSITFTMNVFFRLAHPQLLTRMWSTNYQQLW